MEICIAVIAGILIGFLLAKLLKIVRLNQYHKEVADTLLRCMEMENEYAQALGEKSMIEYTIKKKGMQFGILHFGSVYHLISAIPKKEESVSKVEEAMGLFLHEALRDDIEKYRREREERKKDKKRRAG